MIVTETTETPEVTCTWCKSPMPKKTNKGTIRKYCTQKCSIAAFHARRARRKKKSKMLTQAEYHAALKVVTLAAMSPEKQAEMKRLYERKPTVTTS